MYIIYKLTIKNDEHFYIGSTKNMSKRMSDHKYDCFRFTNRKLYKYLNSIGITKQNFYELIDYKTICICDKNMRKHLENKLIDLNNSFCLNKRNENVNCNQKKHKKQFKNCLVEMLIKNNQPKNIILCNKM